jgi:hypothetical protein
MFDFTSYRQSFLKGIAFLFFYSGALKVFNRIANRLRCNYDAAGKVVFPFVRKRTFGNVQILVYRRVNSITNDLYPHLMRILPR